MSDTKVLTGKVRFSYANVFEPKQMKGSAKPKYSVSLIIPKSDKETISKIKAAIESAKESGATLLGKINPATFKNPLRDGDVERPDDPTYKDSLFVNANSDQPPGIVDRSKNEIIDRKEFYSGCYGRATITFFPFNFEGTKGIGCGLGNIQKLTDGPRLSGGASAQEDFADDFGDDDLMD